MTGYCGTCRMHYSTMDEWEWHTKNHRPDTRPHCPIYGPDCDCVYASNPSSMRRTKGRHERYRLDGYEAAS